MVFFVVIPDDIVSTAQVTIAAAPLQVESGEELRPVMLQVGHREDSLRRVAPFLGRRVFVVFFNQKERRPWVANSITTNPKDQLSGQLILVGKNPMGFGSFCRKEFFVSRRSRGKSKGVFFQSDVLMFVLQRCHV